jgi:hypothetical protein
VREREIHVMRPSGSKNISPKKAGDKMEKIWKVAVVVSRPKTEWTERNQKILS